jgi:hypothetical protein
VVTFWVACAGALALGDPLVAAACLSLYGLGRAAMVVGPALREADAALAAERLLGRRPAVRRVNAVALAACAVALALAPAGGAARAVPLDLGPGNQLDPSRSEGALAYTQREFDVSTAVVRLGPGDNRSFPGGRTPSLDGTYLAYADDNGIRVVRWRTGQQVARVGGPLSKPALDWPWLAYRLDVFDGRKELWLQNLSSGQSVLVASLGPNADLGRPSLAAGRVAWHVASATGSSIRLYDIASETRRILARSRISLLSSPSLSDSRILWADQRGGLVRLRLRRLDGGQAVTLVASRNRDDVFWTTSLRGRNAYLTRWVVSIGFARIELVRF